MIANKIKDHKLSEAALLNNFRESLNDCVFSAKKIVEDDGSITLSLNEIDLVENASSEQEVRLMMGRSIIEYAKDYCTDFAVWGVAVNRKSHLPYVFKALLINEPKEIGDEIFCLPGVS